MNALGALTSLSVQRIGLSFGKEHFLIMPEGLSSGFPSWNDYLIYRQSHGDRSQFDHRKSSRELKNENTLCEGQRGAQL